MLTAGRLLCPVFVWLPPPPLPGCAPVERGRVGVADPRIPAAWWQGSLAPAQLPEAGRPVNVRSRRVASAAPQLLGVSGALRVSQAQQLSLRASVALCRMFYSIWSSQETFSRPSRALCRILFLLPALPVAKVSRRSFVWRAWNLV